MFDTPVDAWYTWLGVSLAGVVLLGVVSGLPTAAPPDAGRLAETVDRVAASDHEVGDRVAVAAAAVRVGTHRVGVRGPGGTAHATLVYGPVTPVSSDDRRLRAVLAGRPPAVVFEGRRAFERALRTARTGPSTWRSGPETVQVRRVVWGEVDATLVG